MQQTSLLCHRPPALYCAALVPDGAGYIPPTAPAIGSPDLGY